METTESGAMDSGERGEVAENKRKSSPRKRPDTRVVGDHAVEDWRGKGEY